MQYTASTKTLQELQHETHPATPTSAQELMDTPLSQNTQQYQKFS